MVFSVLGSLDFTACSSVSIKYLQFVNFFSVYSVNKVPQISSKSFSLDNFFSSTLCFQVSSFCRELIFFHFQPSEQLCCHLFMSSIICALAINSLHVGLRHTSSLEHWDKVVFSHLKKKKSKFSKPFIH